MLYMTIFRCYGLKKILWIQSFLGLLGLSGLLGGGGSPIKEIFRDFTNFSLNQGGRRLQGFSPLGSHGSSGYQHWGGDHLRLWGQQYS